MSRLPPTRRSARLQNQLHEPQSVAGSKRKNETGQTTLSNKRQESQKDATGLFGLPAELRNRIWEYAVLAEEPIDVSEETRPPALVSVSRQVRKEAIGIWCNQNMFNFYVTDYDGTLLIRWAKTMARYEDGDRDESPVRMFIGGSPNWQNLLAWARGLHTLPEDGHFIQCRDGQSESSAVISGAHEIVKRAAATKISWEDTLAMLNGFRHAIKAYDEDWA